MKKLFALGFTVFCYTLCIAQSKEDFNKSMTEFKQSYNQDNPQAIFDSFNAQVQSALPLEQTQQLVATLKTQVGDIKQYELEDVNTLGFADFKTTFSKAVLIVRISLDKESKISGLFFLPYAPVDKVD